MPYLPNSAWNDAAQLGQGLGNTMSQLMLAIPQARAQMQLHQQQQQLAKDEFLFRQHEAELTRAYNDKVFGQNQQKIDLEQQKAYTDADNAYITAKAHESTAQLHQDQFNKAQASQQLAAKNLGTFMQEFVAKGNASPETIMGAAQALTYFGKDSKEVADSMIQMANQLKANPTGDPDRAAMMSGRDPFVKAGDTLFRVGASDPIASSLTGARTLTDGAISLGPSSGSGMPASMIENPKSPQAMPPQMWQALTEQAIYSKDPNAMSKALKTAREMQSMFQTVTSGQAQPTGLGAVYSRLGSNAVPQSAPVPTATNAIPARQDKATTPTTITNKMGSVFTLRNGNWVQIK